MQMHSPRQLLRLAQEFDNERKQTWQRDDGEKHARCQQAEPRNEQPTGEEKKYERDRNKAAAQVVENFPPRQRRDRITDTPTLRVGNARQQPRQNLPVASNPAMPPDGVDLVARRIFLVKCHVAYQPAACVDRFQQVVAQDSIFRKTAGQRALKSIDVINAFADERALAEKVLINIRDGAGVGIDPDIARVQPNES